MKHVVVLLLLLYFPVSQSAELILYSDHIGNLKLSKNDQISLEKVKSAFPEYNVTHGIGQGDSPDFHYISVAKRSGEELFTLYSYFDDAVNSTTKDYDIDLLVTRSELISEEHGISVGDRVEKVFTKFGSELVLVANHHDNSIGKGKIFFQFLLSPNVKVEEFEVGYLDPVTVKIEDVVNENPKIRAISWPSPSWD